MSSLETELDALAAETAFAGVVRIDRGETTELAKAYGLAHRGYEIPNEVDTRFAIASGTKGLTALVVVSLIEEGLLELSTTARSVLGHDLPLIDDGVTVEQLLAHRSGIGDYVDEDEELEPSDYVLPIPVHALATTEQYLAVLDGHATKFAPGESFSYSNGGYVVLALIAERASGTPFHDLVQGRVCEPAGMVDTEFLRSDELPGRTALGYLEHRRRLADERAPPAGARERRRRDLLDGRRHRARSGARSSAAGSCRRAGSREMLRPRSDGSGRRYGLGFWLHESTDVAMLIGSDAGVSFRTVHDPEADVTHTVVSNTSDGAWPVTRLLGERLGTG